ncbi:exosortase-associated protein EpsI, V-type [Sphingomonas sp. BK235]|uniref:exosortase-associated protein EpsI, V-type n=1 Tax=Sphingomonas sp. BK235 TaxID=2512131 RepID=UPI0010DE0114|nr:exosortase-associated protein EpsI, V-type [Sphingomonas sp. BK235]TCP33063.1 EpsI family protein [Sphingomonas sp. BK235]
MTTDAIAPRLLDRRRAIIGGAFLLTAGVAAARVPGHHIDLLGARKIDALIPQQIGSWSFLSKSGLVVPPADQLSDMLYSQLITRVYVSPDELPVMMLVAQSSGQTGILQVHRPEYCYPAGGFTLTDKTVNAIPLPGSTLDAIVMTARADNRTEQLLYWTRVGNDMPLTWAQQRWSVARANLRGDVPDAVMVRLSTLTEDRAAAMRALSSFTRSMFAAVPADVRRVLDSGMG